MPNERDEEKAIIGQSLAPIRDQVRLARMGDIAVLIRGEPGVGKEIIARAIWRNGVRFPGPFLAINCATLDKSLALADFFGVVRGAYTGATDRPGFVETANGGVLFLDEIADLDLAVQAKLLRVLQEGTYFRLGDATERRVRIRIVAATNRDLEQLVDHGRFRKDLHDRLAKLVISVPPLRERPGDIPELVEHFAQRMRLKYGMPAIRVTPPALKVLKRYGWSGNVRELEDEIEILSMAHPGGVITVAMLGHKFRGSRRRRRWKKREFRRVLQTAGGNVTEAARQLGICRQHFYRVQDKLEN